MKWRVPWVLRSWSLAAWQVLHSWMRVAGREHRSWTRGRGHRSLTKELEHRSCWKALEPVRRSYLKASEVVRRSWMMEPGLRSCLTALVLARRS